MAMNAQRILEIVLKAKDEATKTLGESTKSVGDWSAKTAALGAGMIAVGAGVGKGLDNATAKAKNYGGEITNLTRMTNLNAGEASKMVAVFQRFGVEGPAVGTMVSKLSKAIEGQSKELNAAGIATQDATGKNRDATAVLADLAEYYSKSSDKTAAVALATKTLGKNWQQLLPVLAGGKAGIDKITAAAEKNGLIFSEKELKKLREYGAAQKDNAAAAEALAIKVGMANVPLEKFKTEMLGGILTKLNELNPKLTTTAVGLAQIGEYGGKMGGTLLVNLAALKFAFPAAFAWLVKAVGGGGLFSSAVTAFQSIAAVVAGSTAATVALATALGVGLGFAINAVLQKIPGYQTAWNKAFDWVVDVLPVRMALGWKLANEAARKKMEELVTMFRNLPTRIWDAIKNLAATIGGPIQQAIDLISRLNPFLRRSPSLVDNVMAGTARIAAAYAGLGNIRVAAPQMGMPMLAGAGSYGAVRSPIVAHVFLDGRELNQGLARTSTQASRSGSS